MRHFRLVDRTLLERIAREMTGVGCSTFDDAELRHPTVAVGAFHADACLASLHVGDEFRGESITSHLSLQ